MNRSGILTFLCMLLLLTGILPFTCSAQVTANWTGSVSNDWNTAGNWSTGAVPGTADSVQIGVAAFSHQPAINNNVSIAFLLFSGPADTLAVNAGDTLRVSGSIIQGHLAYNVAPNTVLQGSGAVYCASLIVGNGVLPKVVVIKASLFESKVASLNIAGDLTVRSYTTDLLSGAIAHNNGVFALESGQLNLSGQLYLDNFWPVYLASVPGIQPLAKFMININSNSNATLVLSDTVAISTTHVGCDSIDFYHYTSGTGISIVKYTGNNQLLYTNNTPGLDTLPNTYQNLYITGPGIKTAGDSSGGNNLSTAGDLTVNAGTLDLQSFAASCTVNGNFSNRDTINIGSPGITFRGASFVNGSVFNHDNAWVTFSGGTQALTDSTSAGTNLRFVAFADTGTKSIYHGTFAIIPSGKVSLSNNVTVQVDTATFILQSDSTGTAAVTAIPSGSVIKGNVNAQWFVQGSWTNITLRGYRLMSSAVNHTAKTDGTGDYNPNWLKGTTSYDGAIITGLNGHINGFDTTVNPTLYLFREDVNYNGGGLVSGNYRGINKINNTDINDVGTQKRFTTTETADTSVRLHIGNGILFYFRGNKVYHNGTTSGSKISSPYNYPESVTFTNKGTVNQGQVVVKVFFRNDSYLSYTDSSYISNQPNRGINQVGNPYPSAINWDNFSATDSTAAIYGPGLLPKMEIYDPINGFLTYTADPSHNRDSVYTVDGVTNIIASGQGFDVFVDTTSASRYTPSLRFREPAKFNPPGTMGTGGMMMLAVRRSVPVKAAITPKPGIGRQDIRITLMQGKNANDMVLINFGHGMAAGLSPPPDPDDSNGKLVAALWTYSVIHQQVKVNAIVLPARSAAVMLNAQAAQSGTYTLYVNEVKNLSHYEVQLKDKLTGAVIDARKHPKYTFKIDKSNVKSYGDRFVLMITKIK